MTVLNRFTTRLFCVILFFCLKRYIVHVQLKKLSEKIEDGEVFQNKFFFLSIHFSGSHFLGLSTESKETVTWYYNAIHFLSEPAL